MVSGVIDGKIINPSRAVMGKWKPSNLSSAGTVRVTLSVCVLTYWDMGMPVPCQEKSAGADWNLNTGAQMVVYDHNFIRGQGVEKILVSPTGRCWGPCNLQQEDHKWGISGCHEMVNRMEQVKVLYLS